MINYAFWSKENKRDDLQWYYIPENQESYITYEFDLSDYDREGLFYIHVYGSMEEDNEMVFIGAINVFVDKKANESN